jgi:hypothetical protein
MLAKSRKTTGFGGPGLRRVPVLLGVRDDGGVGRVVLSFAIT